MPAAGFENFGCRHEPVPQEPKSGMQILAWDVCNWTGVGTAMQLPRGNGNFGISHSEERVRKDGDLCWTQWGDCFGVPIATNEKWK